MSNVSLQLPPLTDTSRVVIVGMSGSGKSTAAKAYLKRELGRGTRIVFFDPDDEYSQLSKPRMNVDLGPLRQRAEWREFIANAGMWLDRQDLALSVVPDEDDDEAAEQFVELVEQVKHTGSVTLGADELGGFAFGNANAHVAQKALNTVCTKGRKWPCSVVLVSQRMVHVPKTARAQTSALLAMYQNDPSDLAALDEVTGDKTFSARVSSHARGEASTWLSPLLAAKAVK